MKNVALTATNLHTDILKIAFSKGVDFPVVGL